MNHPTPLHFSVVAPRAESAADEAPKAQRALLFVHGILGSGANLRGTATRLLASDPSWLAVLVDLRGHGRSPCHEAPHTVEACAQDLVALEAHLPCPVQGIVGHSFGGKVSLAYHRARPDLERVALLDSAPDSRPDREGSEQTMSVITMLEQAPERFATREQFIEYVHAHGLSRSIADWLAMNLERSIEGFRFRPDLTQIKALLDDYFTRDLWSVVEQSSARIDIVVGGRSRVYGPEEIARAEALSASSNGRVRLHMLPEAGHWVHADDPAGVVAALS